MSLSALIQILNNGIPAEIIGGVSSTMIVELLNKVKTLFKNKEVNVNSKQELNDIKKVLSELQEELKQSSVTINTEKVGTQIINSTFEKEVKFNVNL